MVALLIFARGDERDYVRIQWGRASPGAVWRSWAVWLITWFMPGKAGGARSEAKLDKNVGKMNLIETGVASPELWGTIRRFQIGEGDLVDDARVDVNGATWNQLISLIQPGLSPPMPSFHNLEIVELQASASVLPALAYSI